MRLRRSRACANSDQAHRSLSEAGVDLRRPGTSSVTAVEAIAVAETRAASALQYGLIRQRGEVAGARAVTAC